MRSNPQNLTRRFNRDTAILFAFASLVEAVCASLIPIGTFLLFAGGSSIVFAVLAAYFFFRD